MELSKSGWWLKILKVFSSLGDAAVLLLWAHLLSLGLGAEQAGDLSKMQKQQGQGWCALGVTITSCVGSSALGTRASLTAPSPTHPSHGLSPRLVLCGASWSPAALPRKMGIFFCCWERLASV